MLDWFPLSIFPQGALSASVIVTVWIGITIVCVTNLRLGWVLSGLVVPGYTVPLLIVEPVAAVVVFAEGILTYFVVWFYSEYLTRYNGMSSFFGRDRFFALVLASVAVRIVVDGWVLPAVGAWLLQNHDYAFDYRSNLHSFGLIIVALIANNFWKTGLVRGIWPMAVQVALTWLIVRYVLMEFTNFNMASLAFMYEDIASTFLAAPKAYIILLVTAFIASRLNLFYGWDFAGILIPSLLALQWYEPHKIVTTLAEAIVILVIADLVLRLPVFRNITMEGARKLLLFFNISFAYKYLLSWVLIWLVPGTKITDWFGFGYLLATLMAVKIHDKNIFGRVTRATVQTSFTGMAVASVIGFILVLMPDPRWQGFNSSNAAYLEPMRDDARSIVEILQAEKTKFYAAGITEAMTPPVQQELDAFAAGVQRLLEYRRSGDEQSLESARRALMAANYLVERVDGQYLLLREREPIRHWGTYVLHIAEGAPLMVQVPAPVDEAGAFEAGASLFAEFQARAFAAAGSARQAKQDGSFDVVTHPRTIFQVFHREMAQRDVLQVRSRRNASSVLYVSGIVPEAVRLPLLEKSTDQLKVIFRPSQENNLQRRTTKGNFAELWMSTADANRIPFADQAQVPMAREHIEQRLGTLLRKMLAPERIAGPASEGYQPPQSEALLRIDREVLSPLFALATKHASREDPNAEMRAAFTAARTSGEQLGLEVRWLMTGQENYFLIADRNHYRGWIVIRLGPTENLVLEVPRPLEESGTLELALGAFDRLRGRALVIAGAASDANGDGSADVLAPRNARSLFTLGHQVALREMGEQTGVAMQVRAFAVRPDQPAPVEDAVLSFYSTTAGASEPAGIGRRLLRGLELMGLSVRVGDGTLETAGYEASAGPQAAYMSQTRNKEFAVLWTSPLARRQTDQEATSSQQGQFAALGLPAARADAVTALIERQMSATPLPVELRSTAEQYLATGNVVILSAMQRQYPDLHFERLDDEGGSGAYLIIGESDKSVLGVMSLAARTNAASTEYMIAPGPISSEDANRFVTSRTTWMVIR